MYVTIGVSPTNGLSPASIDASTRYLLKLFLLLWRMVCARGVRGPGPPGGRLPSHF